MPKQLRMEFIAQILFYTIGVFMLLKIFVPIVKPVLIARDANVGQTTFYEKILNNSFPHIKVIQASEDLEDEDRKSAFSIIFKYLTNIDISNPKSYIASQIPILQHIDMTSIASSESGPYIEVIPKNNEIIPENVIENSTNPKVQESATPKEPKPNSSNPITIDKIDRTKPVILIYHTHSRESYNPLNIKDQDHSYDFSLGVCKVGDELKRELEGKYGIAVIHDTTAHDVPTQGQGYSRSRKTVESYLKKYPSLKLIIDLHRDSAHRSAATAKINNVYYSRVMFVIAKGNKKIKSSVATSNKFNNKFNELYPGFSRGLYYSKSIYAVYNQDLSPNLVVLEIGGPENSLDESIRSSKLVARVISEVLKK